MFFGIIEIFKRKKSDSYKSKEQYSHLHFGKEKRDSDLKM